MIMSLSMNACRMRKPVCVCEWVCVTTLPSQSVSSSVFLGRWTSRISTLANGTTWFCSLPTRTPSATLCPTTSAASTMEPYSKRLSRPKTDTDGTKSPISTSSQPEEIVSTLLFLLFIFLYMLCRSTDSIFLKSRFNFGWNYFLNYILLKDFFLYDLTHWVKFIKLNNKL